MAICFPGMASSVKRAATSETRSAPLVITINCTSTMIKKIKIPMTIFPWVISVPKDLITIPASPPSRRIRRVEDTLRPRRNRVVISSREGKIENSSASEMLMVIIRIMMDSAMFSTIRTSSACLGSGTTRKRTMITTSSDMELFSIRLITLQGSYFLAATSAFHPCGRGTPAPPPRRYTAPAGSPDSAPPWHTAPWPAVHFQ